MKIISIHDGHSSAAAYMEDGEVKFAIQEERLLKIKNACGFPSLSVSEILNRYNLKLEEIDYFVFDGNEPSMSDLDPRKAVLRKYSNFFKFKKNKYQKIKSILRKFISTFIFKKGLNNYIKDKEIRIEYLTNLGVTADKISFMDHHLAHAATAAYGWDTAEPFVTVTSDAAGDGLSGSVWLFKEGKLEQKAVIPVADSIARIYSLITYYMGMVPMEHEYKIMGLAPYAEGMKESKEIADYFYNLFELNQNGLTYNRKAGVESVYEFGPRIKEYLAFKRFDVVSAGLQIFIERFTSEWVRAILKTLKVKKVALAGGLFMNVKLNKIISELDEVEDMFVFPSCGDESTVFGILYYKWHELTGEKPQPLGHYYMGGDFNNQEIVQSIQSYNFKNKIKYEKIDNIEEKVASLLADKKIVARFSGRMEFGARALGNRSILANPQDEGSVKTINKMIKNRDFWMPFCPSMTNSDRYIINTKQIRSPYMVLTFGIKPGIISKMIATIHPYDETCRPQEVYEEWNPKYYLLIDEFKRITGESVILNTSFNLHGYPVVYTPNDALFVFDNSGIDHLAIGDYLITKNK